MNITKEGDEQEKELEGSLEVDEVIKMAMDTKLIDVEKVDDADHSEEGQKAWEAFIKKIKLYDIVNDQLIRTFRQYEKDYNKQNPEDLLSIKLILDKRRGKTGTIFAAGLKLEVKRRGLYKVIFDKVFEFTHVRDLREEHIWKYQLYEAMMQNLMFEGLTFQLLKDDVKNKNIKEPRPDTKTNSDGATTK